MEFVLLEAALETFTILKVLGALALEHTVRPVTLILFLVVQPVENAPAGLYTIFEVTFIAAAIAPPKDTPSITFASLKLTLVDIGVFSRPFVKSSALLLIAFKLSNVIISTVKVQFT